nr:PD-(D/E)XK nuclease family protein [Bradyrhizobium diazoefficiens]
MAEVMRSCFLRAGLSRTVGVERFVLGNPRGWLGSIYHNVLEKVSSARPVDGLIDPTIDRLWNEALEQKNSRNQNHALDRRFGPPVSWPGYYLVKASVTLQAKNLLSTRRPAAAAPREEDPERVEAQQIHRERRFSAYGGKLVGRPDVVRPGEIVDFKSGSLVEFDQDGRSERVKAAYVRQLRIYGFLVYEALGRWIQYGLLVPAIGPPVQVRLIPPDCETEASEAVGLLDHYNDLILSNVDVRRLAVPSPTNCKWCPYKIICPSFWGATTADWTGSLDGAAVEGTVIELPRPIHGGAAMALTLSLQAGSEVCREITIAPINPSVHVSIDSLMVGEVVRVVGLRIRPDGIFVPELRTVIVRVSEVPAIAVNLGRTQET